MKTVGVYIHIPFCKSKCYYCDFNSFSGKEDMVEKYIKNLIYELKIYKKLIKEYSISSIFIGGGTPSHIDEKHIGTILGFIKENFNTTSLEEVTIEINPGTLDIKKVNAYRSFGINRISMGVQSLNNRSLQSIGRIHSEQDVYDSYELLRKAGFTNINLDFIFGLPNETIQDVEGNLEKIELLRPEHISYYGLILEEDTQLYKIKDQGKLSLPSETLERDMYHLIRERLGQMGYIHYEISNFSLKDYECKHNILYWEIKPYIGLGLSSHSYLNGKRYWNKNNFNDYLLDLDKGILPIEDGEDIVKEIEISEFCIMGLRLIRGIDKDLFRNRFKKDIKHFFKKEIEKHCRDGLIIEEDNFIRLTEKGLDLSNIVEMDFLL